MATGAGAAVAVDAVVAAFVVAVGVVLLWWLVLVVWQFVWAVVGVSALSSVLEPLDSASAYSESLSISSDFLVSSDVWYH